MHIRNRIEINKWKNIVETVIIALAAFLIFSFVLRPGRIPSSSMEPTLRIGDIVLANGLAYIASDPQRGDIVIFKHDELGKEILIKRVIGIPGDSLMFVDGDLYLNGELLQEDYLPEGMKTDSFKDFDEIPEDCYFVMGDNRTESYDSRGWRDPYVCKDDILGKMLIDIPVGRLMDYVQHQTENPVKHGVNTVK